MTQYTINKTIEDETIDDIMADALHSAISYWCREARIIGEFPKNQKYLSDCLSVGHEIELWDAEEDEWHTLNKEKLLKALAQTPDFDEYDYDNHVVDSLIQKAIFGEVIYG